MESEFRYDKAHDIDWDKKRNNLYWAGSTTGGFALDDQWRYYQRQRFVKLAQNLEGQQHYYLREKGGVVGRIKSSFLNSRLFDVTFTKIFQCKRKYCREQSAYFTVKSWTRTEHFNHDSCSIWMGTALAVAITNYLLQNQFRSLKQTLFREWHDERLMPWVHYVPISQGMEEIPELVLYLTSTEAGQERAKEIGEQGREWFYEAFRDIYLSIYTYRLLLELARLQDPKRQAS